MISIREEIRAIENGEMDKTDNALKNAPHTCAILAEEIWEHPTQEKKLYFLPFTNIKLNFGHL